MGRAPCCDNENVKRGPWSPEEDAKLKDFIEKFGIGGSWIVLPKKAGLKRCGKSCRLRWLNYLRPNLKHGDFSDEEDRIICSLYMAIGSRWSIMAAQLPGRTDNDIKNHWNTKLKKKLIGTTKTSPSPAITHGGSPAPPYPSHDQFSTFPPSIITNNETLNFPAYQNFYQDGFTQLQSYHQGDSGNNINTCLFTPYPSHDQFITCPPSIITNNELNFPAYQNFYQDGFTQLQSYHQGNSGNNINTCLFTGDTSCSSSEGSHHGQIMENEQMGYFEDFLAPVSMNENWGSLDLRNGFDFSALRGGDDTYGW